MTQTQYSRYNSKRYLKFIVKCSVCKYEWGSISKMIRITCPSCGHKTLREKK